MQIPSSLSHAASSAEKNARTPATDSGDAASIVTSFQLRRPRQYCPLPAQKWPKIGLDPSAGMGYVFLLFMWAYVIKSRSRRLAAGPLCSKRVYFLVYFHLVSSPCCRVLPISLVWFRHYCRPSLRFASSVGLAESLSFPGNSRIAAARSRRRRGTAVAIFNLRNISCRAIFAPIMGWLTHEVGWSHVFFFMGGLGIIISFFIWLKSYP